MNKKFLKVLAAATMLVLASQSFAGAVDATGDVAGGAPTTSSAASTATSAATSTAATASDPASLGNSYNFTVPATAKDTCCGDTYDHSNANGNTVAIMQNTNQKLAAVQLAIIETLRLMTGQISGNTREQTGAQHTLADQQDDRSTVKAVEQHTLQAISDAVTSPSACRIITGSQNGAMVAAKNTVTAAYNAEMMDWLNGTSTMSKAGSDSAVLNRLEMHCQKFANENDVADGVCQTQAASDMAGADLDASKSLSANNGVVEGLTDDQALAAQAYILNTAAPVPFTNLSTSEAQTTEGRLRAQRQQTDMARISTATTTLNRILASKRKIATDASSIGWAQGTAANMQGYAGADYSKGVSYDDFLALNSRSFLLNSDELKNSEESPAEAQKQMKNMTAVLVYQQYENYKMLQNIAENLAQQTAILAEGARTDVDFTSKTRPAAGN